MAVNMDVEAASPPSVMRFAQIPGGRNVALMVGVAAVVAIMIGVWLWGQKPEYRVLFSNFSDRDGGAIVAALQQMNVPYEYSDGGAAILVPADRVHDARLRLAAQGLPKGGNVGFELMENQKLGISQFLEQVNFQRALEGELARSIQSVAAVQAARVHLALPKSSVFVRDQQQPTASVLLNLHPGRTLDAQQVSAIVHLVASSVPQLTPKNVTVVDENGTLLSDKGNTNNMTALAPTQLKYVQELQQNIVQRIESILTPIVGAENVRAEATADVDFSSTEQAAETYKPNQGENAAAAVRSQHSSESRNGGNTVGGVPGALTNQPPAPATAPLTTPDAAAAANANGSMQRDSTVNYEVDKTISYVQQPMGGIRRLSVAVVLNHKRVLDADGNVTSRPLTDEEMTQITNLVKDAMGFNQGRGDSLNVVNSAFADTRKAAEPEVPFWKRPEFLLEAGKDAGKYLLLLIVLIFLYRGLLRPMMDKLTRKEVAALPSPEEESDDDALVSIAGAIGDPRGNVGPIVPASSSYQQILEAAKQLAKDDPKVVANVVKAWVSE